MNTASNNTTGNGNTAIGTRAGYGGTGLPSTPMSIGDNNVFVGENSGFKNSGSNNTFIGREAGHENLGGNRNVSVGGRAGYSNSTGTYNTMIGFEAGYNNVANSNTFAGYGSGVGNTIGTQNTFLGTFSGLNNTTASYNTFIGEASGQFTTTGGGNSFLGFGAGDGNIEGVDNLYLGAYADAILANAFKLERAAAIGPYAKVSINDAIVLGDYTNANMKVGIGVHDPQYRLDVKGVVNMRAAFNSPSLKINGNDFLELDEKGQFVLNTFKMKYKDESQWSDKVFEKSYKMLTISELEKFIAKNKHLPNIPSANEVVKKGIEMDKITSKLLEKIEELTLYIIELEKKNAATNEAITHLKMQFEAKK